MKNGILTILTFFIAAIASAKCAGGGIYCLSKRSSLNKNGLIILEFYDASQSLVPDLNSKYPIYLKSADAKVKLNIIETFKGEMLVTQIVLKPASVLKAGTVYTLLMDSLPGFERMLGHYNSSSDKWEPLTFQINHVADNGKPDFCGMLTEQKKSLIYWGCGPERWVYFNLAGQDVSELFVLAEVRSKATGKTTKYMLPIENGVVKVGHGMCSGAFHFDDGNNFEITFQLIDQSGNKSNLTNTISFSKPTLQTGIE